MVDGARRLVAGGSSTFTIGEVAAAAGVSLRSFYRHFAGRDELLLALIEEEARLGAAVLREAVAEAEPPIERVRAIVETFCELVDAGSGYGALLVREHLRLGEEHPGELRVALDPLLEVIEAELRAAAADGFLRPVDRFDAASILSLVVTHRHTAALAAPSPPIAPGWVWEFVQAALAPNRETT